MLLRWVHTVRMRSGQNPNLVEVFVSSMYAGNFGMTPFANRKLSDFCDESRSTWSTTYNFNKALMTPDGLQEWETGFRYRGYRAPTMGSAFCEREKRKYFLLEN